MKLKPCSSFHLFLRIFPCAAQTAFVFCCCDDDDDDNDNDVDDYDHDNNYDDDNNDDDHDDHFRLILFMFRRNWPSGLKSQAAQTAGKEGRKHKKCSKKK